MNRGAALLLALLTASPILPAQTRSGQEGPAAFDSREWDFGAIREADGVVSHAFTVFNADSFVNLLDCSSIGVQRDYKAYISQPREISTFAAYGSFIIGTGAVEFDARQKR